MYRPTSKTVTYDTEVLHTIKSFSKANNHELFSCAPPPFSEIPILDPPVSVRHNSVRQHSYGTPSRDSVHSAPYLGVDKFQVMMIDCRLETRSQCHCISFYSERVLQGTN